MSALNDKAFFVAASARDTQSKALMLVSFAGVLFLEVTLNFIASGSTPHSPCAHLERATSAITSKHAGNELDELKDPDAGSLAKIKEKVEAPSTT